VIATVTNDKRTGQQSRTINVTAWKSGHIAPNPREGSAGSPALHMLEQNKYDNAKGKCKKRHTARKGEIHHRLF
jgi:hypothetical protein